MILAHDLGTTGDKATLVDDRGAVVAAVTEHYPVDFGADGRAEQHPEHWWAAFCRATAALLERSGVAPSAVAGVSFSGQMMGVVPVDHAGEPVRPAIIWADTRSVGECREIAVRTSSERVYAITGHRLNASYSLSKIAWFRRREPSAFARTSRVLQAKDFVAARLTGVQVTDPSDASGTDAYDQATGDWSDELLAAADVPRSLLPEIVPSTTVIGTVTAEAAAATGLLAGTPVVIGGGDGPTAALGAGVVGPEDGAYAYLGSSSWVSVSAPRPLHDPSMRSMTFNHVVPGMFVPTATMQAGGAALGWVADLLAPGEADAIPTLLALAARARASDDGLFFLPHLLGERSPYWNPDARGAFIGARMGTGRAEFVRAVLEGVAFTLGSGLDAFTENGVEVASVSAIGGAAASDLLLQLFADTWGVPVSGRSLVDEANALGAAVVGGVGVGLFDGFDIARSLSTTREPHVPDAAAHDRARRAHGVFTELYRRLEPVFEHVAGWSEEGTVAASA